MGVGLAQSLVGLAPGEIREDALGIREGGGALLLPEAGKAQSDSRALPLAPKGPMMSSLKPPVGMLQPASWGPGGCRAVLHPPCHGAPLGPDTCCLRGEWVQS